MEDNDSLRRLQDLQRDLTAFAETRVTNLLRLSVELDASIEDFKKLLDKNGQNPDSRKKITSAGGDGMQKVQVGDEEYEISPDFRETVFMVSDELKLDELDAAQLCITVQDEIGQPDENLGLLACLRFHRHRLTLLECLRMIMQISADSDADDALSEGFRNVAQLIIQGKEKTPNNASLYWRKCIDALTEIENGIKHISDKRTMLEQTKQVIFGPEAEALNGQRILMQHQHENLTSIMTYLIQGNYVQLEDFRIFLNKLAKLDVGIETITHYLPSIIAASASFASGDNSTPGISDLHKLFQRGPSQLQWQHKGLQALVTVCWLAEYRSRDLEGSTDEERGKAAEAQDRLLFDHLAERPLQMMLAMCDFVNPEIWHDPAKTGLVRYLLDDFTRFPVGVEPAPIFFRDLMMRELQTFVDAFIANMPDVLRTMKSEEDDHRRDALSRPVQEREPYELHFERFTMIAAFAYQDDPEAAQDWWSDKEGNLFGFLRWASRRLPTPRVATFSELLRAIASDDKSANYAHKFLLEDSSMAVGKLRRQATISWAQIFSEIEIFAATVRDKPAVLRTPNNGTQPDESFVEVETSIMLEAYLRLTSHLCRKSSDARNWLLREQSFPLPDVLLELARADLGSSRLPACCLETLSSLLTDKISEVNDGMWALVDNWVMAKPTAGQTKPQGRSTRNPFLDNPYLSGVTRDAETAVAFINLLNALLMPSSSGESLLSDNLPFPEQLGSATRQTGIEAYIDHILGYTFVNTLPQTDVPEGSELYLLQHSCLTFIHLCLSSFNESLVEVASVGSATSNSAFSSISLPTYLRLHPFARVMDFMFSTTAIPPLFSAIQKNAEFLNSRDPNAPAVQTVVKGLQVMNLVMEMQATYFDIVRPIVKTQSSHRAPPVANPALTSFDEVMVSQLGAVIDIAAFVPSVHQELSLEALQLLKRLSASRKFASGQDPATGLSHGNRLVGRLQDVSDAIVAELCSDFQVTEFDLEFGRRPFKLTRAQELLTLLNGNLDASPNRPNIAHCLLGFACNERTVDRPGDGLFTFGKSLFHAITTAAVAAPIVIEGDAVSWLLVVKRSCMELVQKLATSRLTAGIVNDELQKVDFHPALAAQQLLVSAGMTWDRRTSFCEETLYTTSAIAIRDFMLLRQLYFDYSAFVLRTAADAQALSVRESVTRTLMGYVRYPGEGPSKVPSIFDLLDFFDIGIGPTLEANTRYLTDIDFSLCLQDDGEFGKAYDIKMADELCTLRKRELLNYGVIKQPGDEVQLSEDVEASKASLISENQHAAIMQARIAALESWADLLSLVASHGGLNAEDQGFFAMTGLQISIPKLERSLSGDVDAAALIAKLNLALVQVVTLSQEHQSQNTGIAHERLVSAFRVSLKTIGDEDTGLALRDVCYRTCCNILDASITNSSSASLSQARTQYLQLVLTAGERLISITTEDSFSGRGVTRVSSLLFLDALTALFQHNKAGNHMLRALSRLNFVPVLIDSSISSVASAIRNEDAELTTTLAYFHTALSLLLRICQTSEGVQLVMDSGFFSAVHDSQLFSTDPDIGLDIDNPDALKEFYRLLSAVLEVITAIVVTKGPHNAQTLRTAKNFLTANRFSAMAVLKRTSAVQRTAGPPELEAQVVADDFGRLMLVTGFLEDDEPHAAGTTGINGFS